MKIFLDTANIEDIRKYNDMGLLDGITTNPSLLAKEVVIHMWQWKKSLKYQR